MLGTRRVLVYGANGYTAGLLLSRLAQTDLPVVAAGRDEARTKQVAERLGLEYRIFDLTDPARIDEGLDQVGLVLNAAGPFVRTAQPLIDACLRRRVDYLDLSGELDAIQCAEKCDRFARCQGVMLLPAVGFDVVPSDCLAAYLSRRLPGADSLTLSVSPSNLLSRGSASTLVEQAGRSVMTRRGGALEETPLRTLTSSADFGEGERATIAVTWGDLVTAFHSTGIQNIEVYFEATAFRRMAVTVNQYWGWMLEGRMGRAWLQSLVELMPAGPGEAERQRAKSVIVGEARRGPHCVRARLATPEAYSFTAQVAARVVEEVLDGRRTPGFTTPARLLGADFAQTLPGVTLEELR